jgi:hypothetical protein
MTLLNGRWPDFEPNLHPLRPARDGLPEAATGRGLGSDRKLPSR